MTVQSGSRNQTATHLRAVPSYGVSSPPDRQLVPPRFPADLVGLDAQLYWLDRLAACEVCVVQAPAGYGKSAWCAALFAEARAVGWRSAWLSIDRDDAADVPALLCGAFGVVHDETATEAAIADLVAARINAWESPFLLVVDSVDHLRNARAVAILGRLMRRPPTQLRLLLSGRGRHGIPLGDAAARGMLLSVGRAELGLSDADAQSFFAQAGAALDANDIAALNRFVEGWPAALRLLAQRPGRNGAMLRAGNREALAEAIASLVDPLIDELPAIEAQLLRRVAIVSSLDVDLCRLLGGEDDSFAMLRELEARGVFVERTSDGDYRLHPAAAATIARRLAGDEVVQLRRIAARHFARRGMVREAIEQALACGDCNEAAALIGGAAMPLIEAGDIGPVVEWMDRLPPEMIAGSPGISRACGWLAMIQGAPACFVDGPEGCVLELLHDVYGSDRPDEAIEACDRILADAGDLSPFAVDMARAAQALGAARRGLFGLAHDAIRPVMLRRAGKALDLPGALAAVTKARIARAQGQLEEAERLLREARSRLPEPGLAAAVVDAALGRACYERDAFEEAADLAAAALPHLVNSAFQDALISAFLVAIRVAVAAGKRDAAASLIDRAELIAFGRHWAPLKALCVVERARLRLPHTIDVEAIVAIGDEEAATLDPLSSQARAFAILSEMRAYEAIANGDRPRLTAVAARLLRLASNGDDAELRATATLFNILPQLSGRCDKMVELETVRFLNHAASSGFRRTIVDVLDVTGVRAVQNFCSEAYSSDCFLALLKLAEPSRRNADLEGGYSAAPGEAFSFLTEREIEILSALKAGESNKEIARTLRLAPETVKWHLKNIMRKLRAGSREEAVSNAGTLGLKLIEGARPLG